MVKGDDQVDWDYRREQCAQPRIPTPLGGLDEVAGPRPLQQGLSCDPSRQVGSCGRNGRRPGSACRSVTTVAVTDCSVHLTRRRRSRLTGHPIGVGRSHRRTQYAGPELTRGSRYGGSRTGGPARTRNRTCAGDDQPVRAGPLICSESSGSIQSASQSRQVNESATSSNRSYASIGSQISSPTSITSSVSSSEFRGTSPHPTDRLSFRRV